MGSGARRETTTQNTGPPEFQLGALTELINRALGDSQQDRSFYGGQQIADFDPAELQAQQGLLDYAQGGAADIARQGQEGLAFALGDARDPRSNKDLVATGDLITDRFAKRFTEQINPALASEAGQAGQVGSSRQGLAQGVAAGRTATAAADATTQFFSNAYSRGLDTFDRGLAQAGNVQRLGTQPAALQAAVGSQRRAQSQANLDIDQERFYFNQNQDFAQLERLLSLIGGSYGGEGTSQTRRPTTIWNSIFG